MQAGEAGQGGRGALQAVSLAGQAEPSLQGEPVPASEAVVEL